MLFLNIYISYHLILFFAMPPKNMEIFHQVAFPNFNDSVVCDAVAPHVVTAPTLRQSFGTQNFDG